MCEKIKVSSALHVIELAHVTVQETEAALAKCNADRVSERTNYAEETKKTNEDWLRRFQSLQGTLVSETFAVVAISLAAVVHLQV